MKEIQNGERKIRGIQRRLWDLVHMVLLKWQTLVMFQYRSLDVRYGQDEYIQFFIPKQSPHWGEIYDYLEHELEAYQKERLDNDQELKKAYGYDYYPGTKTDVMVFLFDGYSPYLERDEAEKLAEQAVHMFNDWLDKSKKEQEEAKK